MLAANGSYTSTVGAVLNCALGGTTVGTGYGQLQVAGAVTLNGALSVGLTNGYLPALHDSFTVLAAGARSGTFAGFFFPSNSVTMQLSNTANSVVVSVVGVTNGPPIVFSDLPASQLFYAARTAALSVGAAGLNPITYQ